MAGKRWMGAGWAGVVLSLACGGGEPPGVSPAPRAAAEPRIEPAGERSFEEAVRHAADETAGFDATVTWDDEWPPCRVTSALAPLAPARVSASSELVEGRLRHGAERAVDGDPATAWVEGVDGDGVGEGVFFLFPERDDPLRAERPDALSIVPGYARDRRRWRSNNRVREVLIRWLEPRDPEQARPPGGWDRSDLVYMDNPGIRLAMQPVDGRVPLGRPQHVGFVERWMHDATVNQSVGLEVRIVAVEDEGAEHDDTAISELQLLRRTEEVDRRCDPEWCRSHPEATDGCAR